MLCFPTANGCATFFSPDPDFSSKSSSPFAFFSVTQLQIPFPDSVSDTDGYVTLKPANISFAEYIVWISETLFIVSFLESPDVSFCP